MSKGSDKPTTTVTSSLPAYAKPYFMDLMARTQTESNAPYVAYGGQRVADQTGDTLAAYQGVRDMAAAGEPGGIGAARNTFADATGAFQGQAANFAGLQNTFMNQAGNYNAMMGLAGGLSDQFGDQGGYYHSLAQSLQNQGIYDPGYRSQTYEGGEFDSAAAQRYMNPYITNVLDVQRARLDQAFNEQQAGRDAAAIKASAFGGNRAALVNEMANRERNMQLNEMNAQGLYGAYQNAQGAFEADRQARLAAQGMTDASMAKEADFGLAAQNLGLQTRQVGLQAGQLGQGYGQLQLGAGQLGQGYGDLALKSGQLGLSAGELGMTANQYGVGAAQNLAGLEQMAQQMGLTREEALAKVGAAQQAYQQQGLDTAYQDFLRQQQYPQSQLAFYSDILRGVPVSANTQTYAQPPNPYAQAVGLGLGALGTYQAMA